MRQSKLYDNEQIGKRYKRAKMFEESLGNASIVRNDLLFPIWIADSNCFWYERETAAGTEYRLVDATNCQNTPAFDAAALAAALSDKTNNPVDPANLPITNVQLCLTSNSVSFTAFDKRWRYLKDSDVCEEYYQPPSDWVISPNNEYAIIGRNHNLILRDIKSGTETTLTQDGSEDSSYGAVGSSWGDETYGGLQASWSPDSTKILVVRREKSDVKTLPVVQHVPLDGSIRPVAEFKKVAYPGDEFVEEYSVIVIVIATGEIIEPEFPRLVDVRNGWGWVNANLVWWNKDSKLAYFYHMDRGDNRLSLVEFMTDTGRARILIEEISDTHINLSGNSEDYPPHVVIQDTNELIHWSERKDWAHLYLYDLNTGWLKNEITSGEWQIRDVIRFDANRREVFVTAAGRDGERDPYYREVVRINIDTSEITTVLSTDHDYVAIHPGIVQSYWANMFGRDVGEANNVSPTGDFVAITRTRANEPSVSVLVDRYGSELMRIEEAELHGVPEGWLWPEPVQLTAADGQTEIYGLMFKPSGFSPDHSYPIIADVFCEPDWPFVSKGSFRSAMPYGYPYIHGAALAELGFVVIQIDGRGTVYRGRQFRDDTYGEVGNTSRLEDQIAGIRQLAEKYTYLDLDRVGIYGWGAVDGMMRFPDFFKVGVTINHMDDRLVGTSYWNDKYNGMDGPAERYQYPEELVDDFKGKLLLINGMLDFWHPPAGAFRVVEALQKKYKMFDMLCLPNAGNSPTSYMTLRAWNYFVEHLQGERPPEDVIIQEMGASW